MRKIVLLAAVFAATGLIACKKEENSSFEKRITGDWRVVATQSFANDEGVVVEWGFYYVGAVGLKADHSFTVNKGSQPAGTWELIAKQRKIIFYSVFADIGVTYRDTTTFRISVNGKGQLVLEDDTRYFVHKRI